MKSAAERDIVHFQQLGMAEQRQAIRRLAVSGCGDAEISRITGLHVDQVRQAIAETQTADEARG